MFTTPAMHVRTLAVCAALMLPACALGPPQPIERPQALPPPPPPELPSLPGAPGWTAAAIPFKRLAYRGEAESAAVTIPSSAPAAELDRLANQRYAALANVELKQANEHTGLGDGQLARMRAAESRLARGDAQTAYMQLRQLNIELKNRSKRYAVVAGDSLSLISAKPEIYGNPWLWPLIWEANISMVPNPDRLLQGQLLKIRPHPTVDEVAGAVSEARGIAARPRLTVGEVREAASAP